MRNAVGSADLWQASGETHPQQQQQHVRMLQQQHPGAGGAGTYTCDSSWCLERVLHVAQASCSGATPAQQAPSPISASAAMPLAATSRSYDLTDAPQVCLWPTQRTFSPHFTAML